MGVFNTKMNILGRGILILVLNPHLIFKYYFCLGGVKMSRWENYEPTKVENTINKRYLNKYMRDMELRGLSEARKKNVYIRMRNILNNYIPNKDFFKLGRKELENIPIKLQENLKSYHSIYSYIQVLRKFIRVILDLESSEPLPKKFKVLKPPRDKSKYKIFRGVDEIITPAQAFEFVKKATNKRDSFILMLLIDSGLRPHELMKTKRKNIIVNELNYWYIQVPKATKTGFRKVRLIFSIPFVDDFLKLLPKDPNTPLISIKSDRLKKIVKELAGITPYILRHSSASFYSSYLNEPELCERYGWVAGSRQVRCYVHLSQKQIDDKLNKVLKLKNGEENGDDLEKLQPKFCLNCFSYTNAEENTCRVCKQPLDPNDKIKREKLDKIAYSSSKRLLEIAPEEFKKIAEGFGVKIT